MKRNAFLLWLISISAPAQELVQNDFERGYVKDGKKISVWQYFDANKQPELVINHSSGIVSFINKDTSDYFIYKSGQWVASRLDIHPVPIEGSQNFYRSIKNKISYPIKDFKKGLEGKVIVIFEVDSLGNSANYSIATGIGGACDSMAIETLRAIDQKWVAPKVGGKRCRARFAIEIEFRLKENEFQLQPDGFKLSNAKLLTQIITAKEGKIYNYADKSAEFPGGVNALYGFVAKTLRYPANARRRGIEGRVIVKFIVEEDGAISNMDLLSRANEDLDAEAVRVVSLMPKWKPGEIEGIPVRQSYVLPITFRLGK